MWYENAYVCVPVFSLLTVISYLFSLFVRRKINKNWLHPIFVSTSIIILILLLTDAYDSYKQIIPFFEIMMNLYVVAIGWYLYSRIEYLKSNYKSILISIASGSIVSMVIISLSLMITDVPSEIIRSLLTSSANTSISSVMSINEYGITSLTVLFVIMTGLIGAITGPFILRKIGVTNTLAKQLALGCSSHEIGVELGLVEGTVSGLAIGLSGTVTALLSPIYIGLFY